MITWKNNSQSYPCEGCPLPGQLLDAEEIGMSPPRLGLGIGGILKARIQDFRVDEIATKIKLDPEGDLLLQ